MALPYPNQVPKGLKGILKAQWAGMMGDNLKMIQRDNEMKDHMARRSGFLPSVTNSITAGERFCPARETVDDDMRVEVDSPKTTTTTNNVYQAANWTGPVCILALALVALCMLFERLTPRPTPGPTPPDRTQVLKIEASDGPPAFK